MSEDKKNSKFDMKYLLIFLFLFQHAGHVTITNDAVSVMDLR